VTPSGTTAQTPAYADLLFAFGLARLGEQDAAHELLTRSMNLVSECEVHQFLVYALEYRIKQAMEGRAHAGPLPTEQIEYLDHMRQPPEDARSKMSRYAIDRFRQNSRILEPTEQINPYCEWRPRSDLEKAVDELADLHEPKAIADGVLELLKNLRGKPKGSEDRACILRAGLNVAIRVGEGFARELLDQVPSTWDALPKATHFVTRSGQALFLERALAVAAHFDSMDHVHALMERYCNRLEAQKGADRVEALYTLTGEWLHILRKHGMLDEFDALLGRMARWILDGKEVKDADTNGPNWNVVLQALLHIASGWYYLQRDHLADSVMLAARTYLFDESVGSNMGSKCRMAWAYATALGQAPMAIAQQSLEELLHKVIIRDTYTTNQYFGLSQLQLIESIVLSAVECATSPRIRPGSPPTGGASG
jgi:cellulose synthase operon protein C